MGVAEEFLTAFGARDWDRVRQSLAHDSVWTMPGTGRLSGTVSGADALTERARFIVEQGTRTEFERALHGQHGVAFILHNTAESEGRVLDERLATVVTVENDLVVRIDTYLSDVAGKDAFFQ